jgi:plastocyanin
VRAPLVVVLLALLAIASCGRRRPQTYTVTMKGMAFVPAEVVVNQGDTVVWRNDDFFPHTATAAGVFSSGEIASQASWQWRADRKGEHAYVCTLHPTMKARLVVR